MEKSPNVIIVNDFSQARGGATKVALRCIEAVQASGAQAYALFGDDGEGVAARYPSLVFRALGQSPLKSGVSPGDLASKTYNAGAAKALKEMLAAMGPAPVVHVHGWNQILSPSIFRVLAASDARVIVTAHDFFLTCPNGAYLDFRTGQFCPERPLDFNCLTRNCDKRSYLHKVWRVGRMAVQRSAGQEFWNNVTTVLAHEDMARLLGRDGARNLVPLRTPTAPFLDQPAQPELNRDVAFVGRMTWEKGVITLAEALRDTGLDGFMIGEGPLLPQVRSIAPHIHAPGWADDDEVARRMANARFVVMPSAMPEPYGLVAVEALRSGLPVVVSDACLLAREIEASGAGIAFPSGDSGALAAILRSLATDDDRIAAMSRAALALGNEIEPTSEAWAHEMTSIYRKVAAGQPPQTPPNPVWARLAAGPA